MKELIFFAVLFNVRYHVRFILLYFLRMYSVHIIICTLYLHIILLHTVVPHTRKSYPSLDSFVFSTYNVQYSILVPNPIHACNAMAHTLLSVKFQIVFVKFRYQMLYQCKSSLSSLLVLEAMDFEDV